MPTPPGASGDDASGQHPWDPGLKLRTGSAEDYEQLYSALTQHLHRVADFVEFENHDLALESFRDAMAISSELGIRSANVSRRSAPAR